MSTTNCRGKDENTEDKACLLPTTVVKTNIQKIKLERNIKLRRKIKLGLKIKLRRKIKLETENKARDGK